jgi:hypothetical protein
MEIVQKRISGGLCSDPDLLYRQGHISRIHGVVSMLRFFIELRSFYLTLLQRYAGLRSSPCLLSLQCIERSEQKAYAQQIIYFFQEADDRLGLGHEAIDCFELAL